MNSTGKADSHRGFQLLATSDLGASPPLDPRAQLHTMQVSTGGPKYTSANQ